MTLLDRKKSCRPTMLKDSSFFICRMTLKKTMMRSIDILFESIDLKTS